MVVRQIAVQMRMDLDTRLFQCFGVEYSIITKWISFARENESLWETFQALVEQREEVGRLVVLRAEQKRQILSSF